MVTYDVGPQVIPCRAAFSPAVCSSVWRDAEKKGRGKLATRGSTGQLRRGLIWHGKLQAQEINNGLVMRHTTRCLELTMRLRKCWHAFRPLLFWYWINGFEDTGFLYHLGITCLIQIKTYSEQYYCVMPHRATKILFQLKNRFLVKQAYYTTIEQVVFVSMNPF